GLGRRPRRRRDRRRPCGGLRWRGRRGPAGSRRIWWEMARRRRIWEESGPSLEHEAWRGRTEGRRWEAGGREKGVVRCGGGPAAAPRRPSARGRARVRGGVDIVEWIEQDFHGISILRIVSYGTRLDQRIGPLKFLRIGSPRC
uniref:Uncharacterized protein n=1 Tax=Aegilops tauschii subsp. strangulata TaxID=200361 RepID=A0A453AVJ5_AEGTS